MKRWNLLAGLLVAVALGLAGCAEGGPGVEYVEGVVTLDGKPLEGATVGFSPVDPSNKLGGVGSTDATGKYRLTATQGGAPDGGVPAGTYTVVFHKSAVKVLTEAEMQAAQNDPNYGKATSSGEVTPENLTAVPAAYGNPATSGFQVTVKPGSNSGEEFNFELKSNFQGASATP